MKGLLSRKLSRLSLPVVASLGALLPLQALLPAPAANAATTSNVSCSVHVLLLPGSTATCTTATETCAAAAGSQVFCQFVGTTVATAAVGLDVGGTGTSDTAFLSPGVSLPASESTSCVKSLAILGGCTGQTNPISGFAGLDSTNGITNTIAGHAACVWTGGPVAVLATLTCTESMTATLDA